MQFMNRYVVQIVTILLLSITLVACGGGNGEERNRAADEEPARTAQQSAGNTAGTTINVVARDFEYVMEANSAAAGSVTFAVTNEGSMPHDFAITIDGERHKTAMIQPGSSASLTVELAAGSYDYICTIPGHDILGMKGAFTVN